MSPAIELSHIFNLSVAQGVFPSSWNVIPIPQITNPASAEDLRAVSLLAVPSKLIESSPVPDQIYWHHEKKLT